MTTKSLVVAAAVAVVVSASPAGGVIKTERMRVSLEPRVVLVELDRYWNVKPMNCRTL